MGNEFSHSDAPELLPGIVQPVKGDVKIATSLSDLSVKFTVKTNCDISLLQVLMQMKKRYSYIEGKLPLISVAQLLNKLQFQTPESMSCRMAIGVSGVATRISWKTLIWWMRRLNGSLRMGSIV